MRSRRGLTMLELLAVLAILVMVVGLGWPSFRRSLARGRLDAAARELQGELYQTRLEAMKNAAPYAFRFQPGTGVYEILPKDLLDRENATVQVGATVLSTRQLDTFADDSFDDMSGLSTFPQDGAIDMAAPDNTSEPASSETLSRVATASGDYYRKVLPNDIRFGEIPRPRKDAVQVGAESLSTAGLDFSYGNETETSATTTPGQTWSAAILFYPNGRTSTATFFLYANDRYGYRRTLEIRGLTGSVTQRGE